MSRTSSAVELTPATSFSLDLLRALAAQVVLFGHAFDFFDVFSFLGDADPPPQPQRLAVVVFFLLSGFLIARSAARPGASLDTFLAARTRRIYSGLIPALLLIALIDALPFSLFELDFPGSIHSVRAFVANLLHLQGYPWLHAPVFGTGDPLWTLSIEWWLYLFYGALVLSWSHQGQSRSRVLSLIRLLLFLFAAPMVIYNLLGGPGDGLAVVWFLGVGCYWWLARRRVKPSHRYALPALLFLSAALGRVYLFAAGDLKAFDRAFTVLTALSFLCLLLVCQDLLATPSPGLARCVRVLASYSYTLYLTHFTVLTMLYELRGGYDDRLLLVLALALCNLVAFGVAQLGEIPFQRMH